MFSACILAASTGFLSLALEILWVRLFSLANHSVPQAFAFVLIFYLLGIAIGARIGKYFCHNTNRLWKISAVTLIFSAIFDYISPWIYAEFVHHRFQLYIAACLIVLTSLTKSILFPIAHHLGVAQISQSPNKIGRRVANVYGANIFGATLGPLFVGIFLLSFFTTQQSYLICASLTLLLAMYALWNNTNIKFIIFSASIMTILVINLSFIDANKLIGKILIQGNLTRVIENAYGVVASYHSPTGGDYITGGNVYDGRTNLDPKLNTNGINRVIVLSTLVDQPKKILVIGLSIGTWLTLITSFPHVEQIDVLEINPGYLKLIHDYLPQSTALKDPRVKLYIDDGRRWLKLHPENKYDIVVMNTTYHWRAYTSNLLSKEFLQLVKKHMTKNSVLAYNPTQSVHALKTATEVFSHAYLYDSFVISSEIDWRAKLKSKQALEKLKSLQLEGKPLFADDLNTMHKLLNVRIDTLEKMLPILDAFNVVPETITDLNVITEYKFGANLQS